MSKWIDVCAKSQIVPDTGVCAKVEGKQVAIFHQRSTGKLFAIDNFCPFAKANILSRGMLSEVKGELAVASPMYKEHFNLITGQCLEDGSVSVPVYRVRDNNGRVEVAV